MQLNEDNMQQLALQDNQGGNSLTNWTISAPRLRQAICNTLERNGNPNTLSPFAALKEHNIEEANNYWENVILPERKQEETTPRIVLSLTSRQNLIRQSFCARIHWNAIRPTSIELCLNDKQWLFNMCVRLRTSNGITVESCQSSPHDEKMEHIMNCKVCSAGGWRKRHQRILYAILRSTRKHGIYATVADVAARLDVKREEGPDGLVYTDMSVIAIDVSVAHQSPTATHLRTRERIQDKKRKYAGLAATTGWLIAPLVMTSHCTATQECVDWIKKISVAQALPGAFNSIMNGITIACARGNADLNDIISATTPPTKTISKQNPNRTTLSPSASALMENQTGQRQGDQEQDKDKDEDEDETRQC
jgi:hypothetical protein